MNKTTLGKLVFILFLLPLTLLGGVAISVDKMALYRGESVTFTLSASGEDIRFPDIKSIEGFQILGTSSSSSVNIVNGQMTKTLSKSYTFAPTREVIIPAFTVEIGGQPYETEPQKIVVREPKASSDGEPIVLEMRLDKKEAYVGEPIKMVLAFKRKIDTKIDKVEVGDPDLKEFWVKKEDEGQKSVEGDYLVQSFDYVLFPKKAGEFTIPATFANVGEAAQGRAGMGMGLDRFFNDPFFANINMQWQKVYSNDAKLTIKALPQGVYLYGDFTLDATVDATEIGANKPLNLTISVEGKGNIDDIAKFAPDIADVALYADEPTIKTDIHAGTYGGSFSEHIAIVADKDYTIPALTLRYFDAATKQVVTKTTDAIPIHVTGAPATQPAPKLEGKAPTLENKEPTANPTQEAVAPVSAPSNYWLFALGLGTGVVLTLALSFLLTRKRVRTAPPKESDLIKQVKSAKNDRALFEILLPHTKTDKRIEAVVLQLEENLYAGKAHTIDKKQIVEVLEELDEGV